MTTVTAHLTKYGPIGVPNGFVDAQNLGNGNTPCLPTCQSCYPLVWFLQVPTFRILESHETVQFARQSGCQTRSER